ncbi:PilZ domain-containing protein [Rhodopseudomonas thermotolerans]|uniref:PilZ domain-containing protein n=2 Tax=Rhodopseudomonas TaxID=1073 RepID=A0A336JMT1_9BRAD|nr:MULTISPECIES: PilZ domain-containing protein [Rhodopseudomonas]RED35295.1 PilZ domain-containing protein [Rhodopseudomonas pentothenatexigens]REG03138.1 PilZ domain-containing protein [Rhodopseudomonas thermotolerans]SSW90985.1 PilZ domain-containing protein [Rhodopseudomonas pentothenatexigens]
MSVQRFLKQRAVNVTVGGNYSLANWYDQNGKLRQFACRTSRVSPFRMIVDVPVIGRVGDHISSYFSEFGKLEGHISDTLPGGFLLELAVTRAMRERLSNQLSWLERKMLDPEIKDAREQARIVPACPHSTLILADGSTYTCFVIDMSISGVAVSADLQPEIGTPLAVGGCVGRVVRHRPDGFAVKFTELQNRSELEWRIARPPQRNSTVEARVERLATSVEAPAPAAPARRTADGDDAFVLDA